MRLVGSSRKRRAKAASIAEVIDTLGQQIASIGK